MIQGEATPEPAAVLSYRATVAPRALCVDTGRRDTLLETQARGSRTQTSPRHGTLSDLASRILKEVIMEAHQPTESG